MDIYLLRHGQTTQPGTFTGVTDVFLSKAGEGQIRKIAPVLKTAQIEHCYCSPLIRCRDTVRMLELACDVTVDEDLKEIDFGLWEGLDYDQVKQEYPDEMNRWIEQKESFTFPRGARISQFNHRIQQWFDELLNTRHNRVLIVAHGGVLRVGLHALLGLGSDTIFGVNFAEGAVSRVKIQEGFPYLESLNCRG